MRTVIFFGLLCIAESIGRFTGWSFSGIKIKFMVILFIAAMIFDIIDVARGN